MVSVPSHVQRRWSHLAGHKENVNRAVFLLEVWGEPGVPGSTGGVIYNYYLIKSIAKMTDVKVITFKMLQNSRSISDYKVERAERPKTARGMSGFTWKAALDRILQEEMTKSGEFVLITSTSTNAAVPKARSRGIRSISIVQAYEDFGIWIPDGSISERVRGLRRRLATGQSLYMGVKSAEHIITNSEFVRSRLSRLTNKRQAIDILYPPLDLPVVMDDVKMQGNQERHRTVGFVNRKGKNVRFVYELAEAAPDLTFLIFGHEHGIRKDDRRNVLYRGWERDRRRMYRQASTWIVPSKWHEPFGLVAIEALSQGCKVIASRRGGLGEAVGKYGTVIDGYDISRWLRHIRDESRPAGDLACYLERFSLAEFERKSQEIFTRFNVRKYI